MINFSVKKVEGERTVNMLRQNAETERLEVFCSYTVPVVVFEVKVDEILDKKKVAEIADEIYDDMAVVAYRDGYVKVRVISLDSICEKVFKEGFTFNDLRYALEDEYPIRPSNPIRR